MIIIKIVLRIGTKFDKLPISSKKPAMIKKSAFTILNTF